MNKYSLTVFNQSRVYLGLLLLPFGLIGIIILSAEFDSLILGIILIAVFIALLYTFIHGQLNVTMDNAQLQFEWKRKHLFNYKSIDPLYFSDIKTIVLDDGVFLRKIKTINRTVFINNGKINRKDASIFIYALTIAAKEYNIRIIDSWDEFAEKGYLRTAYWATTIILTLATIVVAVFIAMYGFRSVHLIMILAWIPQMLLYQKQMKQKLKNKETQV